MAAFEWIKSRLEKDERIKKIDIKEDILLIERINGITLRISKIDNYEINVKDIELNDKYDFILATYQGVIINGEVLELLENNKKVIGGFKDLFRVINNNFNFPYLNPIMKFILQGLRQHNKVTKVKRLDNWRYQVSRLIYEDVIILALEDYNINIEAVRDAIDKFDNFNIILKAQPNGGISLDALELAERKKFKILTWRELLRELNKKWN